MLLLRAGCPPSFLFHLHQSTKQESKHEATLFDNSPILSILKTGHLVIQILWTQLKYNILYEALPDLFSILSPP